MRGRSLDCEGHQRCGGATPRRAGLAQCVGSYRRHEEATRDDLDHALDRERSGPDVIKLMKHNLQVRAVLNSWGIECQGCAFGAFGIGLGTCHVTCRIDGMALLRVGGSSSEGCDPGRLEVGGACVRSAFAFVVYSLITSKARGSEAYLRAQVASHRSKRAQSE